MKESVLYYFLKLTLSHVAAFVAQQGYERDPRRGSQRVLFLTGFVFSMLLFTAFSANIIAILSQTISLETFEDLLRYTPIKMAVSFFPYFQVSLKTYTFSCSSFSQLIKYFPFPQKRNTNIKVAEIQIQQSNYNFS